MKLQLIPAKEFERVNEAQIECYEKLKIIADMCRANTLLAVKRAGSGHLGSSFSAMDIVVWLYYSEMNTARLGVEHPDRDIYFSSKGHDVPGLYSVLFSLGILSEEKILKLRRFGGLDGHPDVGVRGIEANSGSLGMGISKGRGLAWAKRFAGRGGRVFVMVGDGELQEGQNYEALHSAVHDKLERLMVIVDHNKLQSDMEVSRIMPLGDLENVFRSFGWNVARCDGHDYRQLQHAFATAGKIVDQPTILIADTIKGCGVSFMEHPEALKAGNGLYRWHAGAPDDQSFLAGHKELIDAVNERLRRAGFSALDLKTIDPEIKSLPVGDALGEPTSQAARAKSTAVTDEYVAEAFGQALVELGSEREDLIVLDGDLAADCRLRGFEKTYPERFIENGIAEQDMVSMAGGLARDGLLPVVNSFANFLAARANEQIYNNASERTKIIYACHYAGLIPAGPGKSHQSIRDISLFAALPNCTIIQPGNAAETRMALRYAVNEANENCALRLAIGPSPRKISLPDSYTFTVGRGIRLVDGRDAVLFAYGPVMLNEALTAAEVLLEAGISLAVVNMPWLNRLDARWLAGIVAEMPLICVLEDHSPVGGLADHLLPVLVEEGLLGDHRFQKFGVSDYPACGTPAEALAQHGLDGASLARSITGMVAREAKREAQVR